MFTALDLFAGIGGFSRAVHWLGGTTVGFVEWDAWNRRVLAKHWPEARFHGDIKTFTAATLRDWGIRTVHELGDTAGDDGLTESAERRPGSRDRREAEAAGSGGRQGQGIDLITGGYPCQPFSLAGQRLGAADDRHLWPEMRRVIDLCRPRLVLCENVAGHVSMGLDTVLAELEADGYACGAVVIPACAVNALHRRDRVWIMAHAESGSRVPATHGGGSGEGRAARLETAGRGGRLAGPGTDPLMADAECGRRGQHLRPDPQRESLPPTIGPEGASWAGSGGIDRGNRNHQAGNQTPRPVDFGTHGLQPGLVRRPATGPAEPDLIRAMWSDGSWEHDLPRVVAEEPERRQKLQAAGNAIVPIVAYEILRVMLGEAA